MVEGAEQGRPHRWSEWLAAQEKRLGPQLARTRDALLAHAAVTPGQTLLDIGAGRGLVALAAAERVGPNGRVIGCDLDAECLAALIAAARSASIEKRVSTLRADVTALPLAEESVDVVTARSVLEFVRDRTMLANEAFRVLRPGGRIACFASVNSYLTPHHRLVGLRGLGELGEQIGELFDSMYANPYEPMLTFDERDLMRILEAAGFAETGVNFILAWHRFRPSPEEALARLTDRGVADRPSIMELLTAQLDADAAAQYQAYFVRTASQTMISERRASAFVWGRKLTANS